MAYARVGSDASDGAVRSTRVYDRSGRRGAATLLTIPSNHHHHRARACTSALATTSISHRQAAFAIAYVRREWFCTTPNCQQPRRPLHRQTAETSAICHVDRHSRHRSHSAPSHSRNTRAKCRPRPALRRTGSASAYATTTAATTTTMAHATQRQRRAARAADGQGAQACRPAGGAFGHDKECTYSTSIGATWPRRTTVYAVPQHRDHCNSDDVRHRWRSTSIAERLSANGAVILATQHRSDSQPMAA
mmetsp:Transcript_30039/g.73164  ORF Transcript_30039/g.73164 Transcript_30039/m.73164 type:complete len:248 (+) Transcript_30039:1836-2579(+)